jgi:hypothetical protein
MVCPCENGIHVLYIKWSTFRETMEAKENGNGVRDVLDIPLTPLTAHHRRSHLPQGVRTKNWSQRMEKTKKDQAVKRLQAELKTEKQAEITRLVPARPQILSYH